ncbi:MAG: co-chaperone DjlA [bacterium]
MMFPYRIVGALIGFLVANILGAVLGWFIGDAIARAAERSGYSTPHTRMQRQEIFLETVFTLMGRLAKSDGRISEVEIAHTEQFMSQLGMTTEHRRQAIDMFKRGAEPGFDVDQQLHRFMALCGHQGNLKRLLLSYLIGAAMADGVLHQAEQQILRQVAAGLGFSVAAFEQLLQMLLAQDHFAPNAPGQEKTLDDAYKALGVSPEHSDAEIKRAYRKLMSEYHPDKLMGQGVPEDMIMAATERSQEIQTAYDLIKKHRERSS